MSRALAVAEEAKVVAEKAVAQSEELAVELKKSRAMCGRLLAALTDAAARAFIINSEMRKPAYAPSFILNESAQICRDVEKALKAEHDQS